ncbi:hypothetical protein B0T16DRAFT_454296 [Cercophora newfieldiana]|uniref:Uncharacterized protein n=1 Tax=Cercophora newfieldiana TaxID=92897 RepID=A0AA39YGC5_9PEZI|nr:hypothetical protein B0T16DRAFT_454296 [Cercophora newfieldiana]
MRGGQPAIEFQLLTSLAFRQRQSLMSEGGSGRGSGTEIESPHTIVTTNTTIDHRSLTPHIADLRAIAAPIVLVVSRIFPTTLHETIETVPAICHAAASLLGLPNVASLAQTRTNREASLQSVRLGAPNAVHAGLRPPASAAAARVRRWVLQNIESLGESAAPQPDRKRLLLKNLFPSPRIATGLRPGPESRVPPKTAIATRSRRSAQAARVLPALVDAGQGRQPIVPHFIGRKLVPAKEVCLRGTETDLLCLSIHTVARDHDDEPLHGELGP